MSSDHCLQSRRAKPDACLALRLTNVLCGVHVCVCDLCSADDSSLALAAIELLMPHALLKHGSAEIGSKMPSHNPATMLQNAVRFAIGARSQISLAQCIASPRVVYWITQPSEPLRALAGEQASRAVLMLVSVAAEGPTLLKSGSPEAKGGMVSEAARRLQRSVANGEHCTEWLW